MAHERRSSAPQIRRPARRHETSSGVSRSNGDLHEKVSFLGKPVAYGGSHKIVELRETRMSWVFLTADFAYKLKKPIRLPHLDFSTIGRRRFFCEEELRLNSRLARDTYLDLVPLRRDRAGQFQLGSTKGRVVDWLVKMRHLPQEDMLDQRIETGMLAPSDMAPIVSTLVSFYDSRTPEATGAQAYAQHLIREPRLRV